MTQDNKVVRAVLKYEVDESSVRRAEESATRIERRVGDATQQLGQYGLITRLNVQSVTSRLDDMQDSVRADIEEFNRLRDSVEAVDAAIRSLPDPELDEILSEGDGSRRDNQLQQIDRLGSFGSQIFGGLGNSELGGIAGLVGDLAGGLETLSPTMVATTVAAGGLSLILAKQAEEYQKALEAATGYLDRFTELQQAIEEGATSDDITRRIEALQVERDATQQSIDFAQRFIDEYNALNIADVDFSGILAGTTETFGQAVARINQALSDATAGRVTDVNALIEATERQREELTALNADIALNEEALRSASVALNDQLALQEAQQRSAEELANVQLNTLNQINGLSTESIQARLQQIQLERENLRSLIDSGQFGAEAIEGLNMQLARLAVEETTLVQSVEPLVAAREAETDAIQRQQQALEQAAASAERFKLNYYDSVEQLQAAQQSLLEAEKGVRAAQEKARENEQRLEQETAAELEKIQAEADATRSDNIAKNLKAIENQEKAHKDRIAEINRRANATLANAIANRDAVAGLLAIRARDEQLAEEEKANSDRLSELDAALKEQNDVVDKRLREQLANARRAADQRLQLERQRANDELNTRRQALAAAQQQLQSAQAQEQFLYQFHLARLKQIVETGFRDIEAQVEFSLGKIRGGFAPAPGGGGGLKPFGFTQTPSPQTFAYIQPQLTTVNVYAAAKTTTIRNVANSEARRVLYQVLED